MLGFELFLIIVAACLFTSWIFCLLKIKFDFFYHPISFLAFFGWVSLLGIVFIIFE